VPAGEGSLAHRRHVPFKSLLISVVAASLVSRRLAGFDCLWARRHSAVATAAHIYEMASRLIAVDSLTDRLDLKKIFGRKAPLHVDLGCGDGSFLCAMAQRMPDKNFLGIERLLNRVRTSARKAATLDNVRLLRMESSYAVRYLLPAESVETFYLLFPDPWPKRRHYRRRIVTPDFLRSIHGALQKNGSFYIATDDLDYFGKIKELAESNPGFAIGDADVDLPQSKFWLIFRQQGVPIHWLALRKVSPVK
jgi:tRNA (guanine-N7-)-methyltransferase